MDVSGRASAILKTSLALAIALGLYLSCRGYQSRSGDQAYRLPLLLHRQDPSLFAADPFVRAFDTFNPHLGYLTFLDWASRPWGLSVALAGLFAVTFALTCLGLDRLARATWPESGARVGMVAVLLVLVARAGNLGTNHLFDAMLLDRAIGLALGWVALAAVVSRPDRGVWIAPPVLAAAAWIHPSVGLQLAILLGVSWLAWCLVPRVSGVRWRLALGGVILLGLALGPSLGRLGTQGATLFAGLPAEEFRLLSAYVQSPQHMVPHLWRKPQWYAWACYLVLGLLALGQGGWSRGWPASRVRLTLVLAVNLLGLGLAWLLIEPLQDLRATLFQPFRMATVARGLALVALADRVLRLWERGDRLGRMRAGLLVVGLAGDWTFVIVTIGELLFAASEAVYGTRSWLSRVIGLAVLGAGLIYLSRHDTESGHVRLLLAIGVLGLVRLVGRGRFPAWTPRRVAWAVAGSWLLPLAAMVAPWVSVGESGSRGRIVEALTARWRFAEVPTDDLERLALWCRQHTPREATFIGPPGPKTFRLWSWRSLAFNRAGSPYHAEGLADWAERFRDHVGFEGTTAAFVRAYLAGRHDLESRYDTMTDAERAALARRQGASYVLAAPSTPNPDSPLELLHVEGNYAVYRVRSEPDPDQERVAVRAAPGTG